MTLRSRNRLLRLFCYFTLFISLFSLILFLFQFFANPEQQSLFISKTNNTSFLSIFFQINSLASILSLFVILIYLPITGFFLLRNFEKTQTPELIYFMLFLTGLLLQSFRIFIPLFNLYEGYRSIIILVSRTFFSGQLLSLLSLWFISLYSLEDPLQQADRNALILIVVAVILSFFMPIHTQTLEAHFIYNIGFAKLFSILKYSLIAITSISLILRGREQQYTNYIGFSFSYLLLILGSFILGSSDSYALCIIGSIFLFVGNTVFLKILHAYYLWK